jgi:DNA repair photolyase
MTNDKGTPVRGRGAASNPATRFDRLHVVDTDDPDLEREAKATELYRDSSRTIIATNDSPDVGFEASINPYRGCEHGCVYCYARPTHEYLGLSAGLDFETKLFVKEDAPELLRRELASPRWRPKALSMSGVTDCYQPVERKLGLTRRCLEVLVEFRNPVGIVTKSNLVTRDVDLLGELAAIGASAACLSVTTLDRDLARTLEPRAAQPDLRLAAIEALARAGVPVGVLVAPIIPGLTDHEIPGILSAAASAGATFAGYTIVRLPLAVAPIFEAWLELHAPARKAKVLNRLRDMRGGRLNDPRFGERMRGKGAFAEQIRALFRLGKKRAGITGTFPELATEHFRRPAAGGQIALFE